MRAELPVVFAADVEDLLQSFQLDDGFDGFHVSLAQLNEDVGQIGRRLVGQVGPVQQVHYLFQEFFHCELKKFIQRPFKGSSVRASKNLKLVTDERMQLLVVGEVCCERDGGFL